MQQKEITIKIKSVTLDELSAQDRELVEKAREATRTSLATYSEFHVGAAILMDNGEIVVGSNQENAAYPSGLCAERTAAFYASARYPGVPMKKIAVAAWTEKGRPENLPWEEYFQALPISPCGACRQSLLEYEHRYGPIEVILYGRDEIFILPSIASLLPFSFTEF
ncbi:MAG: cytidine deaminase [Muribaculaceae bacterium]|nr:cytidine deaminase [Muribaculaceae bacterium]